MESEKKREINSKEEKQELKDIQFVQELGLLSKKKKCSKCDKECELKFRFRDSKACKRIVNWRCNKCGATASLFTGTFFQLFRKPLREITIVIKCWAVELTVNKTISILALAGIKMDRHTVGKIFNHLRNVCSVALDKKNIKLGGKSKVVEIDESLYARVKHNVGKDLSRKQVWCFGLVDRVSGSCYLHIVPNRTAQVLLGVLYDHTLPYSFINSDKWASYDRLSKLHDDTIVHKSVNHSLNFVDPTNGACTNKVESYWNVCKIKFKDIRGCGRMQIQGYIDEFMWRKNNCLTREEAFIKILKEIAKLYSPQTTDTKILEIDAEIQQTVANINNIADENDDEYDDEDNENGDDEEEEIVESEQLHFCLNDMNTEVASNSSEVASNSEMKE